MGILLIWPRFLSYIPSIEQDYITHIRFEPYLYAYQKNGRIVVLEEHGSLFNNYFKQYVLMSILGVENRYSIILSNIILGILMVLIIALLLQKKLNLSFSWVLLIFSIYIAYTGRLERNAVDIFIMVLLFTYIHALLNNSHINIKHADILIITMLTFATTFESFPLIVLIALLSTVLGLNFLFTRSAKSPSLFFLPFLPLILALSRIMIDDFMYKYLLGYVKYFKTFLGYLYLLLSGQRGIIMSPLGSLKSELGLLYFDMSLSIVKAMSFLSYLTLLTYSSILAFYTVLKGNKLFIFQKSMAITFLMILIYASLSYFAQLAMPKVGDVYGLFNVEFVGLMLPLTIAFCRTVFSGSKNKVNRFFFKKKASFTRPIITLLSTLLILMAPLNPLIYATNGRLTLYEINCEFSCIHDLKPSLNFIFKFSNCNMYIYVDGPALRSLINLYFGDSMSVKIRIGDLARFYENLSIFYQALSYVYFYDQQMHRVYISSQRMGFCKGLL